MYEVILSPSSAEFYATADRPLALKIARCLRHLESAPRHGNNIKRLKGEWSAYYRFRVGDWRVVYRIDDDANCVYVIVIAHRREVYES